ncbi:hypothetical protein FACS1894184_14230 [Clostridia bacterium]|nr:hypothetical protein FACS1894184_14230 [Clostridia bacterium]
MQWDRQWRILVLLEGGGTALEVSTSASESLRCTFSVEKSLTEEPNHSTVVLYNLSPETRDTIIEKGFAVLIEAGYINDVCGLIFNGEIVQWVKGYENNTDTSLTLVCQDADHLLTSAFVATTLSAGYTHVDVCNECKDKYSFNVMEVSTVPMPRATTLFGSSAKYLHQVAVSDHATFFTDDGQINIAAAAFPDGYGAELTPDTGLIGRPQQTEYGVQGQCLLNPRIKLNTMIHLDAGYIAPQIASLGTDITMLSVTGDYRINKLVYEGDTRGDPWYINFEAVDDLLIETDLENAEKDKSEEDAAILRVAMPGIVTEVDVKKQTLKVQPAIMEKIKDKDTGEEKDQPLPVLEDVPIVWPRAGGFSMIMPINPGDEVFLIVADRCIDNWWQSGGIQPQATVRAHDLSDTFAIPGCWSQPRKVSGFPPTGARLQTDDSSTWVEVRKGLVHIKGDCTITGSLKAGVPWDGVNPAPKHEFYGEKWDIVDIPEVNINAKEYQEHTHGNGPVVDKYY